MSSNIFVTFGSLAGTEQLQTRTRSGVNVSTTQTRTRTLASGSTTQTYQRTRTIFGSTGYTQYTRSCPVTETCTAQFLYTTPGLCSGSCTSAQCAEGVQFCRSNFLQGTCSYFASSISTLCTGCTNWSSSSIGFLCPTINDTGPCTDGSVVISYCETSTTCSPGDWSGWSLNNSCSHEYSGGACSGYLIKDCDSESVATCNETTSWTGWTTVSSCNYEYGSANCSSSLTRDCQTLTSCAFTDWSNWSDVNDCITASPTCEQSRDQGTLQRQCQIV
jgi:hypothetical protein